MQILRQHVVPIIKLLTDADVTVRQRGQTLRRWVNGAVKQKEPLTTSGWWGQSEGVSRAGETYSIHDLEPEDGERNTGLADRLLR